MNRYFIILLLLILTTCVFGQNEMIYHSEDILKMRWSRVATQMPYEWYGTDEAIQIAENLLISQKDIGGWIKDFPFHHPLNDSLKNNFIKNKSKIGGTFDNGATTIEMRFLANVYSHTKDIRYKKAFDKGIDYILIAQYENGGWPQFYPRRDIEDEIATDKTVPYSMHITYNDDAMVNIMRLLKNVFTDNKEFIDLEISDDIKEKAHQAFEKGVDCILNTQIIVDGKPTVWCAQHDYRTLEPVKARSYELESFSGGESVGIVLLLMEIESPSPAIIDAVNYAVKWFEDHKIEGLRLERRLNSDGKRDTFVVKDIDAPPIWARFYDLETEAPFFCSRNGVKLETLSEISYERRNGYGWYTYAPEMLLNKYEGWSEKWAK